jgi:hypothetical protein
MPWLSILRELRPAFLSASVPLLAHLETVSLLGATLLQIVKDISSGRRDITFNIGASSTTNLLSALGSGTFLLAW